MSKTYKCKPNIVSHNILLAHFAKQDDVESCEKWLSKMKERNLVSYNTAAGLAK